MNKYRPFLECNKGKDCIDNPHDFFNVHEIIYDVMPFHIMNDKSIYDNYDALRIIELFKTNNVDYVIIANEKNRKNCSVDDIEHLFHFDVIAPLQTACLNLQELSNDWDGYFKLETMIFRGSLKALPHLDFVIKLKEFEDFPNSHNLVYNPMDLLEQLKEEIPENIFHDDVAYDLAKNKYRLNEQTYFNEEV